MECYNQHLLDAINDELRPYGMQFKLEQEDNAFNLLFFNGTDWEDYACGYYDEELPELFLDAKSHAFKRIRQDWEGNELFVYRKVHGWTHGEPALIYSITEIALFFRDDNGTIESVDNNPAGIDAYENRIGFFCVVADEYDEAFRQIEQHDKNLFND